MKKQLIACVFALLPSLAMAAGGSNVHLEDFKSDLSNKESLQNGMQLFVDYCMGCHTAKYQRYERAADDLGMDKDMVVEKMVVGDKKIGDHMTNAMDPADAERWFGKPVPDLTLEARLRGGDWVYSYLKGFYVDESRPFGVNNVIFPDVGMPHVLGELQGTQTCDEVDDKGHKVCHSVGALSQDKAGSLSAEEYDQVVYDITNFLVYIGEPSRPDSERIGTYSLIFLAIFFVFAYLLKKEYWKDVYSGSWRKNH